MKEVKSVFIKLQQKKWNGQIQQMQERGGNWSVNMPQYIAGVSQMMSFFLYYFFGGEE